MVGKIVSRESDNRLFLCVLRVPCGKGRFVKITSADFQLSRTFHFNYLLHVPAQASASPHEKWPAILFLHGIGESGDDPAAVLREGLPPYVAQRPEFPFIVIAPQCPWNTWWPELADGIDQLLETCGSELPIDHQRVYLTGLSMGGFGSWTGGALAGAFCRRRADLRWWRDVSRVPAAGAEVKGHAGLGVSRCQG